MATHILRRPTEPERAVVRLLTIEVFRLRGEARIALLTGKRRVSRSLREAADRLAAQAEG